MTMAVEPRDLYAALGLSREATQDEIKRAYRSLVRRNHPDTSGRQGGVDGTGVGETLRQIIDAYAVLGDTQRRAGYDRSTADTRGTESTSGPACRQVSVHGPAQPWVRVGPVLWDPRARPRDRARGGTDPA
jgi:DnaJ-class molecular chaperone